MIDPLVFREVLGCYPTGVCVITASDEAGNRFGLVVGTFTSISLDPPLVGFFPDKGSGSWPLIEATGRFCVNVLGSNQLELCRRFAARGEDKFAELAHGHSPSGMPLLEDALAWVDCTIERVVEVGDHYLAVGAVEALGKGAAGTPLTFFRGAYHDLACITGD
ncbi:flavin reductase family protein [Novosphingobium sp. ZN18A2]|uniref:flavin reductase family protein n=1 Tax=Novosphingobium sp. ZN18A2 TaxID=3079861 RepID=UPI0030D46F25